MQPGNCPALEKSTFDKVNKNFPAHFLLYAFKAAADPHISWQFPFLFYFFFAGKMPAGHLWGCEILQGPAGDPAAPPAPGGSRQDAGGENSCPIYPKIQEMGQKKAQILLQILKYNSPGVLDVTQGGVKVDKSNFSQFRNVIMKYLKFYLIQDSIYQILSSVY